MAFAPTAAAGLLFAIGPALRAARSDPLRGLKNRPDSRGVRSGGHRVLVVGQVAISLTLVTGAVLLGRSLLNLQRVEIGYIARHALLATVDLSAAGSSAQERTEFVNRFLERVRSLPGVAEATVASKVPPSPVGGVLRLSAADLQGVAIANDIIPVDIDMVGEAYFSTLGLPILRGRGFTEADAAGAPPIVIINVFMARRYWPGEEPIGRRILDWEIVGVAGDVKARSLREGERYGIWRPFRQTSPAFVTLIVRTAGDPLSLGGAIRGELRAMHPDIPLADVRSLEEHVARASSQERLAARVAGGFSLLALLLAAIGLYGLLAYLISRRRREIGVRLAIGAGAEDISRLVMSDGLRLTATGVALGIPVALLCGRLVESLAFEVDARDAGSFGLAAALLLGIGAAAAYLPARRAAAVDPTAALRED